MSTPLRLPVCVGLLLAAAPVAVRAQSAAPGTGRIEGAVQLSTALSTRKPPIRLYGDYGPGSIAAPTRPPQDEFANVVIYLDSVSSPATPDSSRAQGPLTIQQKNETFIPHVLPVLRGATVQFPNEDPIFHNVFSLSRARSFDLGRYPKGASKSVRFDRAGIVQVFCHIHSDMSAVVLVLENPFFTVPARGRYGIAAVPPGDYRVVAWHERIKPLEYRVHVEAGKTTVLDLNIPLPPEATRP